MVGIISNLIKNYSNETKIFENEIYQIKKSNNWVKKDLLDLFKKILEDFNHIEKNKFLDEKM